MRMRRNEAPAIVLFDGLCNLCDGAVRFMLDRDRRARLRFASLQSEVARDLLRRFGRTVANAPASIIVIDGDRIFERSAAILHVAETLGPPWSFARVLAVVPEGLRDAAYRFVARNRYAIFGRRDACRIPTAADAERFLT
jgi:predicted DCC family thiol-disulfide oxidoreductase YuxK